MQTFLVTLETPDGPHSIECRDGEFVWNAAARAGIQLPAICHQGRCLTCACQILEGELDQSASASYFPEDLEAGYALICTGRPRSNLVLRTHQQWAMRAYRKTRRLPAPYS
ncbi:MAG: 2Fe-2S iron-sulfur cluster binding domain-containing protein [Acidobacteriia bacterium]|nr:2Fe-2S iron-sulfur cluster binding domain-containing protein [Terriglobia bacterium]